jgi:hypothetical protein
MPIYKPIDQEIVLTSGFYRDNGEYHGGIDISVPQGSICRTVNSGTVRFSGLDEYGGAFMDIVHSDGSMTRYLHLNRTDFDVVGSPVSAGQQIALTGGTPGTWGAGLSTGPHLHFEVWDTTPENGGKRLDPETELFDRWIPFIDVPVIEDPKPSNMSTYLTQDEYNTIYNLQDNNGKKPWISNLEQLTEIGGKKLPIVRGLDYRDRIVELQSARNDYDTLNKEYMTYKKDYTTSSQDNETTKNTITKLNTDISTMTNLATEQQTLLDNAKTMLEDKQKTIDTLNVSMNEKFNIGKAFVGIFKDGSVYVPLYVVLYFLIKVLSGLSNSFEPLAMAMESSLPTVIPAGITIPIIGKNLYNAVKTQYR